MGKLVLLLQSRVAAALLGAVIFLATMAVQMSQALSIVKKGASATIDKIYKPSSPGNNWETANSEVEQMAEELKREREALRARAQEVDAMDARVRSDRSELDRILNSVKKLQEDFDQSILRVQSDETANLKRLAKVYSSMEPAGAVTILKELDNYSLVKILLYLKEVEVAPILEALARLGPVEAKRAASISESLRTATSGKSGASQPGPGSLAKAEPKPDKSAKPAATNAPSAPPPTAAQQP